MFGLHGSRRTTWTTRVLGLVTLATVALALGVLPAFADNTLWWQELAPRPIRAQSGSAGQVGGYIWVLGGKTTATGSHELGGALDRVDRYNPATNTWEANIATLDSPRVSGGYATRGQYIYMVGGSTNTEHLDTVTAFDTASMTCTTIGQMAKIRHGSRAAIIGDTIYIVGGRDENDLPLDSVEAFQLDPSGLSGTSLGIVATVAPARFYPGVWVQDGKLYVAGGRTSPTSATDTCWEIDPAASYATSQVPALPAARWAQLGVEMSDGRVYIANAAPPEPTLSFKPGLNPPWRQEGSMPMQRHATAVVGYNDKMYSIGGYLNPPHVPVPEVYDNNNVATLITLNDRQTTQVTGSGSYTLVVQNKTVTVEFPSGTTTNINPTELTIATMPQPPGGVPTGFTAGNGTLFEIMTNAEFAPGTLTITMPYAGGTAPQVRHWNGSSWDDFTSRITAWDKGGKTVTFETETLSPFALFESPAAPVTVSTPASSIWSLSLLSAIGIGAAYVARRRFATRSA